jgi:hypothetical protein
MKVTALACVAMMESAMAYQGMVFPASRKRSTVSLPRLRYSPYVTIDVSVPKRTTQSSVLIPAPW